MLTDPVPFPVYGIALVALFAGFVLGGIVAWFQGSSGRRRIRELQRRSEREQREIAVLRERLGRLEVAERQATIPPAPLVQPVLSPTSASTAPTASPPTVPSEASSGR